MVPNEASSGAVALLNMYNYVLDSNQIKQNFINISSQVFSVRELSEKKADMLVYPNPAGDHISIDLKELANSGPVDISIFNMMGSRVYHDLLPAGSTDNIVVNTSSLPEAIYFIKAETDTKISGQNFVIKR
jgi:hypothetical protein